MRDARGATAAWVGGATARELAVAWPFADFVAIADAFDSGDRIEFTWQTARVDKRSGIGEFIEAAMREPRLRRMYPFRSVSWLSFRPTADEYQVPGPWVRAVRMCLAEMDRLGVPSPD